MFLGKTVLSTTDIRSYRNTRAALEAHHVDYDVNVVDLGGVNAGFVGRTATEGRDAVYEILVRKKDLDDARHCIRK